ncbi:MAG: response regulator [Holophaga sp.]|nr:response regulator [Holophaga sp.]
MYKPVKGDILASLVRKFWIKTRRMRTNSISVLVDDDDQVREISARRLSGAGHVSVCAVSGEKALALLSQQTFGLVLLDIMMQGMSGIEVLRTTQSSYPGLAVTMVTSEDNPQLARDVLELGAVGYLVKPFSENEFLIYVSHMLRLHQLEKEHCEYRENLEKQVAIRTMELNKSLVDLKSSQEQLIQQEKIATIGHLAAGVAHEIKNPTGYISNNL